MNQFPLVAEHGGEPMTTDLCCRSLCKGGREGGREGSIICEHTENQKVYIHVHVPS